MTQRQAGIIAAVALVATFIRIMATAPVGSWPHAGLCWLLSMFVPFIVVMIGEGAREQ